jgi:hypothetical protein
VNPHIDMENLIKQAESMAADGNQENDTVLVGFGITHRRL